MPSANQFLNVAMYDVDGFNASAESVAALHTAGIHAVCYITAGTWENWRPDAGAFPPSVQGSDNGWPGEKWLDVRSPTVRDFMTTRFQMCTDQGFDAVEPDNLDGYSNSTGFPLTYQDQIDFNKWIATTVHAVGMSGALKNGLDQRPDLLPSFDFALTEQCFQYNACSALTPFITADKAVFEVEYGLNTSQFCSQANTLSLNPLKKIWT